MRRSSWPMAAGGRSRMLSSSPRSKSTESSGNSEEPKLPRNVSMTGRTPDLTVWGSVLPYRSKHTVKWRDKANAGNPSRWRDVRSASGSMLRTGRSQHVAHADRQRLRASAKVKSGGFELGRRPFHCGVAREAEAFLGHHAQNTVEFAIGVFVMQHGNGIAARLETGKGQFHTFARRNRQDQRCRVFVASREDLGRCGDAGAHNPFVRTQLCDCNCDLSRLWKGCCPQQ